ncbi:SGNH/GDSL hydrolase family protein [Streptomyces sp. DSM 40750]|uniref:SGNH/GDSL hydrolase family protein n=1 Tax=Streptomyces sp. DSM 40750 TaxID=2801030 RepID=UPI00214AAA2B|nr:SGNH/GDSL hydrolase family protein [Streptomyces sp. DSM 40750]UUU23074.1 SGNH/GDSL hydrolase family protein [Streptomyces sp. DSM 40750]
MRKLKAALVAGLMTLAGVAVANTPAQAATSAEYVALGDSYASGVGAGSYDASSGDCKRSTKNYPRLWAAANPEYALKDVTCSGATIADVRANQLSALSANTNLVTLTVGGNDTQFSTVVRTCLTDTDAACAFATGWMSSVARNQLVNDLTGLYKDIKARSPKALILVFGYPQTLSTTGTCSPIELSPTKRTAMNGLADALAEGTQKATVNASVYFIDMRKQFTGHGACGTDPWVHSVDASDATASFHPNAAGHEKGYAATFKATWG